VLGDSDGAIALDLPGFGATPPPGRPWGSADYAEAVLAVLDEIGARVTVLGHSFGGRVALHLARLAPQHVSGLVLTGVPQLAPKSDAGRPNRAFQMMKLASRVGLITELQLERARTKYGSRDYREAEGVIRGVLVKVLAERYAELLPEIACPVELVWGAIDTTAPLANAEFAESALKRAHLEVLDGVGHMVPTDAPEALRAALDRLSS
jgi:pimeloyl-ACP methyl ester carboxylesterase